MQLDAAESSRGGDPFMQLNLRRTCPAFGGFDPETVPTVAP